MKALSIRQPWAWLIVRPDLTDPVDRAIAVRERRMKLIENRTWSTPYRGPLLIHAGSGMTRPEYHACMLFLEGDPRTHEICDELPPFDALNRGGIVGKARLVACVQAHESPFFCGPVGWVFSDTAPLPFAAVKGALGLFNVAGYMGE